MSSLRHRLSGLPLLALLAAAVGCSSSDGSAAVAVPSPDATVTGLCRNLDEALPRTVDGLSREDPRPASALTAGWGSPAIILRCGVPRPAAMDDPEADGVEVNGVGWLMQQQDDGSFRFTTTLRVAYVEVTIPVERSAHGMAPLVSLAPAIKKTIPEGVAD
ncbi:MULTISPECIES: DUF3515 domain-containing protein [Streptomyces]|uniref:DUF3515 domain-containing protein n=1 Tax=Streptomyces TaxID=1883 RepID=UPI00082A29D3|nr:MULTISPECIES: DUF3515 domain-containing protein [Streptomyces]MDN5382214.1 DUF3515 domain-containing protein [Streptomyces sp. LB8]